MNLHNITTPTPGLVWLHEDHRDCPHGENHSLHSCAARSLGLRNINAMPALYCECGTCRATFNRYPRDRFYHFVESSKMLHNDNGSKVCRQCFDRNHPTPP